MPSDSVERMWGEYALLANERGWGVANELAVRLTAGMPTLGGRRTLDVGSGVGGTVIGCATFGADATGIEPDAERRILAQANADDQAQAVRFDSGDLLDPMLPDRLGQFDAVTAIKVVEHVGDAQAAVGALASLTGNGGVALVDIPNGQSVEAVIADGHYFLPGLSLITDRSLAASYHRVSDAPGVYDVTDYHDIDVYLAWFEQAGFELVDVVRRDVADLGVLDTKLGEVRAAVNKATESVDGGSDIGRALSSGLTEFLSRVETHRSDNAWLKRHVLTNTWRVVASKGPLQRQSNRRMEAWTRRTAKRIPGLQALIRRGRRL